MSVLLQNACTIDISAFYNSSGATLALALTNRCFVLFLNSHLVSESSDRLHLGNKSVQQLFCLILVISQNLQCQLNIWSRNIADKSCEQH